MAIFCFDALSSREPGSTSLEGALAESERQQARTEQHEACCGQCEETAGNEVMIAHGTPVTPDARPNLLKISESSLQ